MKRVIRDPNHPWPQLLLSICRKYANLYSVQSYVFLTFQLGWLIGTSNLFCPNRIHALSLAPEPVPPPASHSSTSIAQWTSLLIIQLWHKEQWHHLSFLPHPCPSQATHSFSRCYWDLALCQVLGFYLQKILITSPVSIILPSSYSNHHHLPQQAPNWSPCTHSFLLTICFPHCSQSDLFKVSMWSHHPLVT